MINDTYIDTEIGKALLADYMERDALHEPSGKLTASSLYQPLRFQIMKTIGVPRKTPDVYALGKFKRGNDVEDWYVKHLERMGIVKQRQFKVDYRNATGYADIVLDSDQMHFKQGLIPHEVKSVTNMKLKHITKTGEPDYHYQLQACFYALGMGVSYYAVDIVSAEDLRRFSYTYEIAKMRNDVDEVIARYQGALDVFEKTHELPPFEPNPKVPWTENLEYAPFAEDWIKMDDKTLLYRLEAYKNQQAQKRGEIL